MNVDELTGEALDRAVHEKVFGLKAPTQVCGCADYHYAVYEKGLPPCPACEQRDDPLVRMVEPYSSNIERAWEVVQKMRELGYVFVCGYDNGPDDPAEAAFTMSKEVTDKSAEAYAAAEEMPEAICRAALKRVQERS